MDDRALLVGFVDYVGRLRVRLLPPGQRERAYASGVTYNRANLNLDVLETLPARPVLPSTTGEFAVVGVRSTERRFPVEVPYDICFGRLADVDGTPWQDACPRSALERAVDRLAAAGLHALVGFEPEGYLLAGDGTTQGHQHFSNATALVDLQPFLSDVIDLCAAAGVPLEQCSKELGPSQFELNLPPRDPLSAADDLVVVQEACRNAARARGQRATFLPRLAPSLPSSGSHVHLSIHDGHGNALGRSADELADRGRAAIAGLLDHAGAISLVALPTVNSYRRLLAGSWVPVLGAWSRTSRDALVRVLGVGAGLRVEYRGADGCANPHLLVAALLHAVADGIERELPLDDALHLDADIDASDAVDWEADGRPVLPRTLADAIAAFGADGPMRGWLGPVVSDVMVQLKQREWERFVTTVSEWDRATYLTLY